MMFAGVDSGKTQDLLHIAEPAVISCCIGSGAGVCVVNPAVASS
jgi:hypothetical protein